MTTALGDLIRSERKACGWTQRDLTRRMGGSVSQQTVSSWERGNSRPGVEDVERLAAALDLDCGPLLKAAGHAPEISPPVRPQTTVLDLLRLAPPVFEDFCADLLRAKYDAADVSRFGSQGHKQDGIDGLIEHDDGSTWTYQCKREKQFGPADMRTAINAVQVEGERHLLLLARTATPDARREVLKYAEWRLWDLEDLSREVRNLPKDRALRIVDTYFPGWREHFLGVTGPGPWLARDEAGLSGGPNRIFSHEWKLVGRQRELAEVSDFLATDAVVGVLEGRGGLGKTRLLHAIADQSEASGWTVRFVDPGARIGAAQFELLPMDRPLLVILDDVQDRDDLTHVVSGIRRRHPQAKIILSMRPYGRPLAQDQLRKAGLHPSDVPVWRLDDLTAEQAISLVAEALGNSVDDQLAGRLAAVSRDCPLIGVVGAVLIDRGLLDPANLEGSEEMRDEILRAFRDAIVAGSNGTPDQDRAHVLDIVAATQPFRMDDQHFKDTLEKLTDLPFDRANRHLRSLEEDGVLLRRTASLRVVPDLLGDVVLAEASLDIDGVDTGFVRRVVDAAEGEALSHFFVNACRVDWQVRQRIDTDQTPIASAMWSEVDETLRAPGLRGRSAVLRLLKGVAYYQPGPTLKVIRWVMDNPTDLLEDSDQPPASLYPPTPDSVVHDLAPLLRLVSYNLDYLTEALDLLWKLAQDDNRETNRYPDHPMRVLVDLAGYGRNKPLAYNESVARSATAWLRASHGPDCAGWRSPFDVLDALLATEGSHVEADALTLQFSPFLIQPESVEHLRQIVLTSAMSEVRCANPRHAVRAVRSIEKSLRGPVGMFGRKVSAGERDQWQPHFVNTVTNLKVLFTETPMVDPIVGIAVRGALRWHAEHGSPETQRAAREVLDAIPDSLDHQLALLLHDGWLRISRTHGLSYQDAECERQEEVQKFLATLQASRSDVETVNLLEKRLAIEIEAFGNDNSSHIYPFVAALVDHLPDAGREICARVSTSPDTSLRFALSVALSRLALAGDDGVIEVAQGLLHSTSPEVVNGVAQAFGWGRSGRSTPLQGEMDLLLTIARDPDPSLRLAASHAIPILSASDASNGLVILDALQFDDSAAIAGEVCALFGSPFGSLDWLKLNHSQRERIFEQLELCPTLDQHEITAFLNERLRSEPVRVLQLLKGRIEQAEFGRDRDSFEPLPFHWAEGLSLREHPDVEHLLTALLSWLAQGLDSWQRCTYGGRLFRRLVGGYDDAVLDVIERYLGQPGGFEVASVVLREAPRQLVLNNASFVVRVLDEADRDSKESLDQMKSALYGAVISGSRSGTPGKPFPEDVEQKLKAREIARQLPAGSVAREFYEAVERAADESIQWHATRDEALEEGRNW